jgi:iron complex outermembrane recepter protein
LNWVAGLFYLDIDADVQNGFMAPADSVFNVALLMGPPTGADLINGILLDTQSASLFGQVEFDLTAQWRLIAGARVVREKQDYSFRSDFRLNTNDYRLTEGQVLVPNIQPAFNGDRSDTLFAGKVQIEFRPNDDVMWFAGFNRGVKGGSYNAMLPDNTDPLTNFQIPYEPEVLHSLELGFKSTLAGGRVQLNGSAFYYDYKDYQAFTFSNVSGTVSNNDATNKGLEFDVSFRPIDGLSIVFGASYFDAEVEDLAVTPGRLIDIATNTALQTPGFVVTPDGVYRDTNGNPVALPMGTGTSPGSLQDVEPTFAPKTQLSAQLSYEMPTPALADGAITFGLNASWSDDFWHNLRNHQADKLDGYSVTDLRVGWKSGDQRFGVTAFVNNVFDERYASIGFNLADLCACNEESYGRPRWWGVTFRYNFAAK